MKTHLNFDTINLIKLINTKNEFYVINKNKNDLNIVKKYFNYHGCPFSVNLPEKIKVSPEVIGLIVGEGFINNSHFVFANSNEICITKTLDFLKQFNLPIKYYLEISVKGVSKKFISNCINFWQKQFNIKLKRVRLRKEFYNTTKYGTLHIQINNSLLAKLFKQIIFKSKKLVEINKDLSVGYLKGIIAAEGNVNVKKKTSCVYMVRISASKEEEREHYKRCLKNIGIKISCVDMPTISKEEGILRGWKTNKGRAGAVIISKWDNFVKLLELSLFELHKDKEEKFLKYFINNKFTKQFLAFSVFLNKKFTMKQVKFQFNLSGRNVNRLLTLLEKDYADRIKEKNYYIYKLNQNYINLFNKFPK